MYVKYYFLDINWRPRFTNISQTNANNKFYAIIIGIVVNLSLSYIHHFLCALIEGAHFSLF